MKVSSESNNFKTGIEQINMVSLNSQSSSSKLKSRTRGQSKNNFEGEFPNCYFKTGI